MLLSKLFKMLSEKEPPASLAQGLAWKILFFEMRKPRPLLVFLTLPIGIYFAVRFVGDLLANEIVPATLLAISNFSLSLEYIVDQLLFINDFFPYETFLLTSLATVIVVWGGMSIAKQLNHVLKTKHII